MEPNDLDRPSVSLLHSSWLILRLVSRYDINDDAEDQMLYLIENFYISKFIESYNKIQRYLCFFCYTHPAIRFNSIQISFRNVLNSLLNNILYKQIL